MGNVKKLPIKEAGAARGAAEGAKAGEKPEKNEREKRIEKEFRGMKKLLTKIPEDRRSMAEKLMRRAAFMRVTLEDLEEQIARNGYVSKYQNGENQFGTKKSPEVDIYNTTVKNYAAIVKQIADMVPEEIKAGEPDDGFDEYVRGRG